MKIIDLEQDTPEWHSLRRKSIGASDCSIIMGNNPHKDEYTLFQEKMGVHQDKENEYMREGKRLEPIARELLSQKLSLDFMPRVIQSKTRPWQIASLDALDGDDERGWVFGEIKCSAKLYEQARYGIIPQMYIDQMQHQMSVTELSMGYYQAYWQSEDVLIEVKRDDEYIAKINEKEAEFYRRMVEFDPPQPTHKEITQPDWLYEADVYQRLCKQEAEVKKLKETSKQRLIELGGGNAKGAGITLTKVLRPGIINYENAIKESMSFLYIDVEKYRGDPIEYWVITKERK